MDTDRTVIVAAAVVRVVLTTTAVVATWTPSVAVVAAALGGMPVAVAPARARQPVAGGEADVEVGSL